MSVSEKLDLRASQFADGQANHLGVATIILKIGTGDEKELLELLDYTVHHLVIDDVGTDGFVGMPVSHQVRRKRDRYPLNCEKGGAVKTTTSPAVQGVYRVGFFPYPKFTPTSIAEIGDFQFPSESLTDVDTSLLIDPSLVISPMSSQNQTFVSEGFKPRRHLFELRLAIGFLLVDSCTNRRASRHLNQVSHQEDVDEVFLRISQHVQESDSVKLGRTQVRVPQKEDFSVVLSLFRRKHLLVAPNRATDDFVVHS